MLTRDLLAGSEAKTMQGAQVRSLLRNEIPHAETKASHAAMKTEDPACNN